MVAQLEVFMTLAQLSKEIGVSTATISRVINKEGNVSESTCKLVEKALVDSGYTYRTRNKTVKGSNSDLVCIVAGELANPITISYIEGIQKGFENSKKKIFIGMTGYDLKNEYQIVKYAITNGFSGVFMLNAIESDALVELIKHSTIPIILVNRYLKEINTDVITVDNYRSGYIATRYLIEKGHTRIAHLAGPKSSISCQNRMMGYLDAMKYANLSLPDNAITYVQNTYENGYAYGKQICDIDLTKRYTAVYCVSGIVADGVVDAIFDQGLKVPDDISIICNDNSHKEHKTLLKLTTVEQDPFHMGEVAAVLFMDKLRMGNTVPQQIVNPPILEEGNSVKKL